MLLKKQLHDVSTVVVFKSNCYPLPVGRVRASVRDGRLGAGRFGMICGARRVLSISCKPVGLWMPQVAPVSSLHMSVVNLNRFLTAALYLFNTL